MKVILKQDVKGLGKKEQMVEASDGYARNFLLPKGLAVEATSANVNIMKTKKEAEAQKKEREVAQAKELAKKIKDITVTLKVKAGENGKLFGSITSKDVAEALKTQQKLDIDKKKLVMPDSVKSIGTFDVEVKLYPEINSKFTVKIENL
ncbi:50S ribosomal protein L9 [Ruminiclostridium cellulolyticum]|uniref:Large ribosomal subunit protein bL9 n=1 Tax=Ruminiclostridium cellulolyticum (strain ATCC 35319 / DSM 5812 / JCM 6584 / H10) TaxID=394503 RepID=RL9_RUMCH|nr:50S ribosomal protein L9 [Ruminiclostridium cellulolyticum]B8I4B5.1 RecName: Full=Large ribosomal subunit protein bL9; AltName: Full=50S ribosomal protein L9 [Ruminiclostridium cellulolyticum H10]ACL74469.1 ribosomal protein L9 [Ruminiclostridium cellulolyticum H10]